ncbi:hypothetical protein K474DRAFT_1758130 [Panus rudis PR-1116 ss-1]|nr:hypothetical protein K474DRAFT_1758130 [Panus rudis PR-1116 ss-1]
MQIQDVHNFVTTLLSPHPICNTRSPNRLVLERVAQLYFPQGSLYRMHQIHIPRISQGRQRVVCFLVNSFWAVNHTQDDGEIGSLAQKLIDNPNLLPFHHILPAVQDITSDLEDPEESPFGQTNCSTRGGFFSALLWRIITYSSEAVKDGFILFHDLKVWKAFQKQHQRNSGYIFNPRAYGRGIDRVRRNGIRNAALLWQASQGWEAFLRTKRSFYLQEMFEYIQSLDCLALNAHIAYLLARDYVDTELVKDPTPEEVGKLIWQLNGEALQALLQLGLVLEAEFLTEELIISVFVDLYHSVKFQLEEMDPATQDESYIDRMQFSPLMLEHALCMYIALGIDDSDLA